MGNYNPHAPYIIGQEWVPIRQANYQQDLITERGYTFRLDHSAVPVSGTFSVAELPGNLIFNTYDGYTAVYPAGTEDLTGPIHSVIIPASAISATGFVPTSTVSALLNPVDFDTLVLPPNSPGNVAYLGINFAVTNYAQQLFGKRILDVQFIYSGSNAGQPGALENNITAQICGAAVSADNELHLCFLEGGLSLASYTTINACSASDINVHWNHANTIADRQPHVRPWRYNELAWFDPSAPAHLRLIIRIQISSSFNTDAYVSGVALHYAALKVIYCEERRLKYGAFRSTATNGTAPAVQIGTNFVNLAGTDFSITGALPPGEYTVTQTRRVNPGGTIGLEPITLNGVRQLYELPSHRGVLVHQSVTDDDTFTVESTDVLPHITLHTSAAIVTGSHPYGTVIKAPVYGSITATQEIEDDPVGTAKTYPQVRFYARRFGDTTVSLTLTDVATGLSTASITPTDFDALPEIVDGWREVTLRFATPPTFATAAGDIDWRWSATGENASNQWQVLGADGPSPTGAQSFGVATYYAPVGNTVTLNWQSPAISGTAEDTISDAVLIFSQDPPTVTDFAITTLSQEVTGIGLNCGSPPESIVTGIAYNHLTWLAQTSLPVTGFGYYEIQRSDTITDWDTIAKIGDTTVAQFDDFEARVGVATTYRIRVVNVLDFVGSWATSSPITIAAPGVFGNVGDGASVFIFTSNHGTSQSLAYTAFWERTVIENYAFPEAETVQLHRIFEKDFPTAFRPSERGGERFPLQVLVHNAAIAAPSRANFRDLRDLAWADLPHLTVRDELGNRWFATVIVPVGFIRVEQTTYVANLDVIQILASPTPVDTTA